MTDIKISPHIRDLILAQQESIQSAHSQIAQMQSRLNGMVHAAAVQASDRPLDKVDLDISQIKSCTISIKNSPKPILQPDEE